MAKHRTTPREMTVTLSVTYVFEGELLQDYLEQLDDYDDTADQRNWFVTDRFIGHDNLAKVDKKAKLTIEETQ